MITQQSKQGPGQSRIGRSSAFLVALATVTAAKAADVAVGRMLRFDGSLSLLAVQETVPQ